jgi:hypothetical protein
LLAAEAPFQQIPAMARDDQFESKRQDAAAPAGGYAQPMIRSVMNRSG